MKQHLISLPRLGKQTLVFLVDAFLIFLAVWLAFSIRLDRLHFPNGPELLIYGLAILIAFPIFVQMGLYRAVFRYAGQHALWSIARAVFFYGMIFFALIVFWDYLSLPKGSASIPRSLGILQPIIMLVLIVSSRSLARLWLAGHVSTSKDIQKRTLIYGAGDAGAQVRNSLLKKGHFYIVGFIDDDPQLRHKTINGLTIYSIDEVDMLISEYGVTDILLALPSIHQSRRNEILNELRRFHVHVRSLPSITDLAEGKIKVSDIRELDVADLLGRDPVAPNKELFEKNIKNQVVMVTGAGGSIGSELTRQILFSRPKILILLEQSEFALYILDTELKARIKNDHLDTELVSLLGNVRQYDWIKKICSTWQINTIYHAAAYKHVPIVEHNVTEGVLNNVWGTLNAARAAIESGVDQFVLISTDKAVRPSNVMGASKRLAEMVLQALANQAGVRTQLSMVRFGNVLGSSGSVVPLFRSQINAGGPVTVTHPEVTRYFMTIPEAAQLVIQAGAMASISGAEGQGAVFVLDMSEPVKIYDLAQRMIELSGFSLQNEQNPDGDIAIEMVGLRPGEKLYEELLIGDNPTSTEHPKIMKAQENFKVWSELEKELIELQRSLNTADSPAIYEQLKYLVSGFTPDREIVDFISSYK
uniref:nucleoside-diphosphate sugar epimerase/dehydratase n=1 Tax=Polynucleobacter sp. TaxID=2029855 RepID=UPI0040477644